jgi:DNA-binding beta-propeller fold protein YncE
MSMPSPLVPVSPRARRFRLTACLALALAAACGGDPTLFVVDSQGATNRLVRLEAGSWNIVEVATLPNAARGLAHDTVNGYLYWTSRDAGVIQRSSLDGSGLVTIRAQGLDSAYAIALGTPSGALYWSDYGTDQILRWERTSDFPEVLVEGLSSPRAIAVDEAEGWIYWVDRGTARVQRASLVDRVVEDLVTEGLVAPYGIALDPGDGSLLVADAELGSIFRIRPGTWALEPWLLEAGTHPSFIAVDPESGVVYWTDNRDNVVRRKPREGGEVEILAEGFAGPRGLVLTR